MSATTAAPTAVDVGSLDPYALMAVLGKRVIHPGGRRATEELIELGAECIALSARKPTAGRR